jgi:hypothetical protein
MFCCITPTERKFSLLPDTLLHSLCVPTRVVRLPQYQGRRKMTPTEQPVNPPSAATRRTSHSTSTTTVIRRVYRYTSTPTTKENDDRFMQDVRPRDSPINLRYYPLTFYTPRFRLRPCIRLIAPSDLITTVRSFLSSALEQAPSRLKNIGTDHLQILKQYRWKTFLSTSYTSKSPI